MLDSVRSLTLVVASPVSSLSYLAMSLSSTPFHGSREEAWSFYFPILFSVGCQSKIKLPRIVWKARENRPGLGLLLNPETLPEKLCDTHIWHL